jgi:hypothetical protein
MVLVDDHDILEEAIFEDTGHHPSQSAPSDFLFHTQRLLDQTDAVAFVNPNHEEYVELVIRIPRV